MNKVLTLLLVLVFFNLRKINAQNQDSLIIEITEQVRIIDELPVLKSDTIQLTDEKYDRSGLLVFHYKNKLKKIENYNSDGDAGDSSSGVTLYLKENKLIYAHQLSTCFVGSAISINEKMYFHQDRLIKLESNQIFHNGVSEMDDICGSYAFSEQEILNIFKEYMKK